MSSASKKQGTRVFKKGSPNGKITVYLGKRDFVDHVTHVDPIDGNVKPCDGDDVDDDDDDFEADVELSQCVYCPSWTIGTSWWTKLNCWSVKHCQSNYIL